MYDPVIGRFISPDTIIPSAANSQAYNRYTYVKNNPLSLVDPTGHRSWRKKLKKTLDRVVNVTKKIVDPLELRHNKYVRLAVAAVAAYYTFGAATTAYWQAASAGVYELGAAQVYAGYVAGSAAAGGVAGGVIGGNMKSAWQGALGGAISGGLTFGGDMLTRNWNSFGQIATRSAAAGAYSDIQGGSFSDGFKSTFGIETLNWAALEMRASMVSQSCQGGNNPNCTGQSVGFRGDGVKLGGARCIEGGGCPSNLLGGVQGQQGTFFGFEYQPGSFRDRLVEAFGGPHDFLNSFMYNPNGNLNPAYASGIGGTFGEAVSWLNVVPASLFTAGSVAQPLLPYAHALDQR